MTLVVDTHAHFIPDSVAGQEDTTVAQPELAGLPADLSAGQLLGLLDGAGVDKLVQVTPSVMRFDNGYALEVARHHPDRVRIIAALDATSTGAQQRLRALAGEEYVVGVRLMLLGESRNLLDADALDAVWREASERRLPVSVYAPCRAGALLRAATAFPDLQIIVDHACVDLLPATPASQRFDGWDDVIRLASCGNVSVKVSGLPEATGERFPYPAAQQRLVQLVDAFGPSRLMWASNFPPGSRAGTYAEAVDWVRTAAQLDDAARAAILGGTAVRVLRLPWGA